MVRRVGFGEEEKPEKPHKRHVGRHKRVFGIMPEIERVKAEKKQRQKLVEKPANRPQRTASGSRQPASMSPTAAAIVGNLLRLVFLFSWLLGWTAALLIGLAMFANASGLIAALLVGWLGFAAISWLVAAVKFLLALFRLLRGRRPA